MTPLEEKIAELRGRFVARSDDEIAAIDAALEDGNHEVLIERAHSLAGIAGMFGFDEIGRAALALEEAALSGGDAAASAVRLRQALTALAED